MKLYTTKSSPFGRCVRVLIRELGLESQVSEFHDHPFDNHPDLLRTNPLAKIPCMIDSEGGALFDSEVICSEIDQQFANGKFQPMDRTSRVNYSLVRGMMDVSVQLTIEKKKPKEQQSEFWLDRHCQAIERSLVRLQSETFSSSLTMVSITVGCLLEYLDFRHQEHDWHQKYSQVYEKFQSLMDRTSFQDTQYQ